MNQMCHDICRFIFVQMEELFYSMNKGANKLMKKAVVFALLFALLLVSYTPTYASDYDPYADALYSLGLFKGTGTNANGTPIYSLDNNATRVESLVMLIRLLGEENAALSSTASHPFTDVPNGHWSYSYVAYAYSKGYTQGTSSYTFSPNAVASANMYITYLLRALGYDDAMGDFNYSSAINKAVSIDLIPGDIYSSGEMTFQRDDCAYTSFLALGTKMKGANSTLADNLERKGVITKAAYEQAVESVLTQKEASSFWNNVNVRSNTDYFESTRYSITALNGSISVPNNYNIYALDVPYTDEMCYSQGIDPEGLRLALSLMDNNALIIPADEQYSSVSQKIYLKVKEKKYQDITLSELSKTEYELLASTIVSSFKAEQYETVEGNGLRFFVFKYNQGLGYTCRYATILNGHMIYVYSTTGDTSISPEQQNVLEYIALSIKANI